MQGGEAHAGAALPSARACCAAGAAQRERCAGRCGAAGARAGGRHACITTCMHRVMHAARPLAFLSVSSLSHDASRYAAKGLLVRIGSSSDLRNAHTRHANATHVGESVCDGCALQHAALLPVVWCVAHERGQQHGQQHGCRLLHRPESTAHLNSTVPTAVDGSMGVNRKWLRGLTTTTSYWSTSMTWRPVGRTGATGHDCIRDRACWPRVAHTVRGGLRRHAAALARAAAGRDACSHSGAAALI